LILLLWQKNESSKLALQVRELSFPETIRSDMPHRWDSKLPASPRDVRSKSALDWSWLDVQLGETGASKLEQPRRPAIASSVFTCKASALLHDPRRGNDINNNQLETVGA